MAKMRNGQTVPWIVICAFIIKICMESPAINAYAIDCPMFDNRLLPCGHACCVQPLRGCCWCFSPDANLSSIIGPCINQTTATSPSLYTSTVDNAANDSAANQTLTSASSNQTGVTTTSASSNQTGVTTTNASSNQGNATIKVTVSSGGQTTTATVSGLTVSSIPTDAFKNHTGAYLSSSSQDSGLLPWAVALIVVSAICLLILLVLLILGILKRKNRRNNVIIDTASVPPLSSRAPSAALQRSYHAFKNERTPRDSQDNVSEDSDSSSYTAC